MFKKIIKSTLIALSLFIITTGAIALADTWEYRYTTIVTDNTSVDRDHYPALLGWNVQTLIDSGKLNSGATNSNMLIGNTELKYMISTDNVCVVIPSLAANSRQEVDLYTGYSPVQTTFPVITGDGGYVTVDDSANIEPTANFTISVSGVINTDNGTDKDIAYKQDSYKLFVSPTVSENITLSILSTNTTTETLRPVGAGDRTTIDGVVGAATHWEAVNDSSDSTYLVQNSNDYDDDLYSCNNSSNTTTINHVTIYFRLYMDGAGTVKAKPLFKIDGTTYTGTEQTHSAGTWVTKNQEYTSSPATSANWTWTEINNMQIGIDLSDDASCTARCSEIYIEINHNRETTDYSVSATGISSDLHTISVVANEDTKYINPTNFTDSSNAWNNEANTYDNNTATYANDANVPQKSWSEPLILNITETTIDGFRFWVRRGGAGAVDNASVELYYDSAWHTSYNGTSHPAYPSEGWYEVDLGINVDVTSARLMFFNDSAIDAIDALIYEFDFEVIYPLSMYIDGVEEAFTSLSGRTIPNSGANLTLMRNNVMPYADNITIDVLNIQQLYLCPNTMLIGTNIPDRAADGTSNNGTITWGSNTGIEIVGGGVESYASTTYTGATTGGVNLTLVTMPTVWYADSSDLSGAVFYDTFNNVASDIGMPVRTIYYIIVFGIALVGYLLMIQLTDNTLFGLIVVGVVLIIGMVAGIIDGWFILALAIGCLGLLYVIPRLRGAA